MPEQPRVEGSPEDAPTGQPDAGDTPPNPSAMAEVIDEASGSDEPLWVEPMREVILAAGKTVIKGAADTISSMDFGLLPRQNPEEDPEVDSVEVRDPDVPGPSGRGATPAASDEQDTNSLGAPSNGVPTPQLAQQGTSPVEQAEAGRGDLIRVDAEGEVFWVEVRAVGTGAGKRIEYRGSVLSAVDALGLNRGDEVLVSSGNVTSVVKQGENSPQAAGRRPRDRHAAPGRRPARQPSGKSPAERGRAQPSPQEQARSVVEEDSGGPIDRNWES